MIDAAKAYDAIDFESRVMNASPLELLIILHERLIGDLYQLRRVLPHSTSDQLIKSSAKIRDVIQRGFLDTLNYGANEEIAKNLAEVYLWSLRQVALSSAVRDENRVTSVINAYRTLLSAWEEIAVRGVEASKVVPAKVR